jgi:predicted nucleotidyltransferase
VDGELLDTLRKLLAARDEVALAVVFGSVAKGSARPSSDLDLALLPTGAFSLEDEARLVPDLERATGREVDLVRLDRTEDIVLRREIGLHGVAVREARPGNFARFRAEAQLDWLDLEPTYLDAEARFLRRVAAGPR